MLRFLHQKFLEIINIMGAQDVPLKRITDKEFAKPRVTIVMGTEKTTEMLDIIKKDYPGPIKCISGIDRRENFYHDAGIEVEDLVYESDCLRWSHQNGGTVILDHCFRDDRFLREHIGKFTSQLVIWYTCMPFISKLDRDLVDQAYLLPCLRSPDVLKFLSGFTKHDCRADYALASKQYQIFTVVESQLSRA